MKLIESKTLGTAQASIEFTSIPQDGTDLVALVSPRSDGVGSGITLTFNTGGTYSRRRLYGTGSGVASDTAADELFLSNNGTTANTFGNSIVYIPNYTGSTAKSFSVDSVTENNATAAFQMIVAGLWSETGAITSVKFTAAGGANFVAGTIISLYKVTKGSDGIVTTSP
jgi:hypothetical protein